MGNLTIKYELVDGKGFTLVGKVFPVRTGKIFRRTQEEFYMQEDEKIRRGGRDQDYRGVLERNI